MNSLNSIIIEGVFTEGLMEDGQFNFSIESTRYFRKDGVKDKKTITVNATASGRVAESCEKRLKAGRGIRIVGRLDTNQDDEYEVFAEHVEFRPMSELTDGKD